MNDSNELTLSQLLGIFLFICFIFYLLICVTQATRTPF
jgi:hypothetical protein